MRKLTRKCLAAGLAVTAAGVASAQGPGRAADRPPAGWLAGPTSTAVRPLTGAEQAAASVAPPKKPSLVESTFSGVKSFIAPPPGTPATPTPLPQGMQPPAAPYPASPSVYAGPPAYRWYGYGAVTPGRNPHAPDGVSPRGSPNWYAQSGATPGAFPVTVTASGQPATVAQAAPPEPPSYTVGNVAGSFDRTPTPPTPVAVPDPSQPLPGTSTASVEPASLSTPAAPEMTPLPVTTYPPPMPMPASEPTPTLMPTVTPRSPTPTVTPRSPTPSVTPPARLSEPPAFTPTAAATPAASPAEPPGPQPLLTWNSTSTDPAVAFSGVKSAPPAAVVSVAAVSPTPPVSVTPATVTVTPVSSGVVPASFTPAPAAPAVATPTWGAAKPVGRSQGPGDAGAPTLDQAVRNAAYGFAAVLEVKHTGPSAVAVRLQAATAADARSAAELVSKLPALKPYAVEFVVTLTK